MLLLLFASEHDLIADAKCLFFSYSGGACGIVRGDKNIKGREAETERQYNTCSFPYTALVFPEDQMVEGKPGRPSEDIRIIKELKPTGPVSTN